MCDVLTDVTDSARPVNFPFFCALPYLSPDPLGFLTFVLSSADKTSPITTAKLVTKLHWLHNPLSYARGKQLAALDCWLFKPTTDRDIEYAHSPASTTWGMMYVIPEYRGPELLPAVIWRNHVVNHLCYDRTFKQHFHVATRPNGLSDIVKTICEFSFIDYLFKALGEVTWEALARFVATYKQYLPVNPWEQLLTSAKEIAPTPAEWWGIAKQLTRVEPNSLVVEYVERSTYDNDDGDDHFVLVELNKRVLFRSYKMGVGPDPKPIPRNFTTNTAFVYAFTPAPPATLLAILRESKDPLAAINDMLKATDPRHQHTSEIIATLYHVYFRAVKQIYVTPAKITTCQLRFYTFWETIADNADDAAISMVSIALSAVTWACQEMKDMHLSSPGLPAVTLVNADNDTYMYYNGETARFHFNLPANSNLPLENELLTLANNKSGLEVLLNTQTSTHHFFTTAQVISNAVTAAITAKYFLKPLMNCFASNALQVARSPFFLKAPPLNPPLTPWDDFLFEAFTAHAHHAGKYQFDPTASEDVNAYEYAAQAVLIAMVANNFAVNIKGIMPGYRFWSGSTTLTPIQTSPTTYSEQHHHRLLPVYVPLKIHDASKGYFKRINNLFWPTNLTNRYPARRLDDQRPSHLKAFDTLRRDLEKEQQYCLLEIIYDLCQQNWHVVWSADKSDVITAIITLPTFFEVTAKNHTFGVPNFAPFKWLGLTNTPDPQNATTRLQIEATLVSLAAAIQYELATARTSNKTKAEKAWENLWKFTHRSVDMELTPVKGSKVVTFKGNLLGALVGPLKTEDESNFFFNVQLAHYLSAPRTKFAYATATVTTDAWTRNCWCVVADAATTLWVSKLPKKTGFIRDVAKMFSAKPREPIPDNEVAMKLKGVCFYVNAEFHAGKNNWRFRYPQVGGSIASFLTINLSDRPNKNYIVSEFNASTAFNFTRDDYVQTAAVT